MDNYTKAVTLDVAAENNHQFIKAKQGDITLRCLAISLLKDGVVFIPDGVANYIFRCAKPDGTAVVLEGDGSAAPIEADTEEGVYTITLSEQCLTVAGRAVCDLAMEDSDGNVLSSADFVLNVIPMPRIGNLVDSSTEWTRLTKAIAAAEEFSQILAFQTAEVEGEEYIQYTTDGSTWVNLCAVSDIVEPITTTQIDALWP